MLPLRRLAVPVVALALMLPGLAAAPAGAAVLRGATAKPAPCPKSRAQQVWQVPVHEAMLTFDDGPHPIYTPKLLAILKKAHVKATFFLIGRNAQEYPDVVRQIKAAGMVIGNHSWDHPNLAKVSSAKLASEIDRTSATLKKITGAKPCFFRFPYGSANASAIAAVNARGMTPFIWTVDTRDWAGTSTAGIISTVWRELSTKHGAVILQHDIQGPRSINAVPAIIAGLRARGYTFITAYGGKPSP
jgi:peptidoglycan-N-acetylglucosamine deacetylase